MNNLLLFNDYFDYEYRISDLIEYLKTIKERNDTMITRIIDIISKLDYSNEDIATILQEDVSDSLQLIIDILTEFIS